MSGFLDSGSWDEDLSNLGGGLGFGGSGDGGGMGLSSATSSPGSDFSITNPAGNAAPGAGDQWDLSGGSAAPGVPGAPATTPGDPMAAINAGISASGSQMSLPGSSPDTRGAKPVTARLADALNKLGAATKGEHNPAPVQANLGLRAPSVQSAAYRGQNGLTNLVQLLMQRAQMYGPPSGGPSGGGGRGLLGM
jgi:hypothetical protein